jgi:AGCS family alanine or glycine:cation symporter
VILSSGVWTEKFETTFKRNDAEFIEGSWSASNPLDASELLKHLNPSLTSDTVRVANGEFEVHKGELVSTLTVIHNRSIADDVRFKRDGHPLDGTITIVEGKVDDPITISGRSLLHSVPLTIKAFKRSFLGDYGQYAVTLGLVLFAFSTAIAWSYYGDRAVTYLVGTRWVMPYRMLYVLCFFLATIVDTEDIWLIAQITLALMALPNLIGIMLLRKEMKQTVADYWRDFNAKNAVLGRNKNP